MENKILENLQEVNLSINNIRTELDEMNNNIGNYGGIAVGLLIIIIILICININIIKLLKETKH